MFYTLEGRTGQIVYKANTILLLTTSYMTTQGVLVHPFMKYKIVNLVLLSEEDYNIKTTDGYNS